MNLIVQVLSMISHWHHLISCHGMEYTSMLSVLVDPVFVVITEVVIYFFCYVNKTCKEKLPRLYSNIIFFLTQDKKKSFYLLLSTIAFYRK